MQRAIDRRETITHVGDAGTVAQRRVVGAGTVIVDVESELAGCVAGDVHADAAGIAGVLGDVLQGFENAK